MSTATKNVNPGAEAPATLRKVDVNEPVFQPIGRFRDEVDDAYLYGGPVRRFAEHAADIAAGARVIMALALDDQDRGESRRDADEPVESDRPLLNANQLSSLQRMAIASLGQLESDADSLMKWAFEHYTREGQAERNRRPFIMAGKGSA